MKTKPKILVICLLLISFSLLVFPRSMLIQTVIVSTTDSFPSEIRGMFVKGASDWNAIVDTCSAYGINMYVGEAFGTYFARYPSSIISGATYDYIGEAIKAAHAHGATFYAMMLCNFIGAQGTKATSASGAIVDSVCPTKQASRNIIKSMVEEVATKYPDLDGFVYDYIRYDTAEMCYCDECKAKFIVDTGKSDVIWRTDVVSGGKYYDAFLEWRIIPLTEEVRDIHTWMLAKNPKLKFGIAAWTCFQDSGIYWRKFLGQDTADWVHKGYIDIVMPMMYTTNLGTPDGITDYIESSRKYFVGGIEGKAAFVPWISTGVSSAFDPAKFQAVVNKVRELKTDGFMIYQYKGLGGGEGFNSLNYLPLITTPNVFLTKNIGYEAYTNSVKFTWETNLPTNSTVEVNTSPLFTLIEDTQAGFKRKTVTYVHGTLKTDGNLTMTHSVTIDNMISNQTYYCRIKSADPNFIFTSSSWSFKFISGTTLPPIETPPSNQTQNTTIPSQPLPTPPIEPQGDNGISNMVKAIIDFFNGLWNDLRRLFGG